MRCTGLASVVYLLTTLLSTASSPAQLTGTATLSGKVLNAQTNAPIPKATVALILEATPPASAIALTSATGDFSFENLPVGQYRLRAYKQGFRPVNFGSRALTQSGALIMLEEGIGKDAVVIRLPMNSTISGLLVDSDGDPIVATDVSLYRVIARDGHPATQPQGGGQTDERGAYRFDVTQPGRYCISANTNPSLGFAYYNNTGKLPMITLPVLYPAGCGTESGRTLDIATGGRIANLDIVVPSARAARPKGKVLLPENFDRSSPIQVLLASASELFPRGRFMGFGVLPSGDIMGGAIVPGEYTITASYDLAGVKHSATARVDFAPGEEKEFTLTPRPTFTIPCKLSIESPKPDSPTSVSFYLEVPNQMMPSGSRVTWEPGKDCRIANVTPGRWRLQVNPVPAGYYVKSARLGSLDILRKEFDLPDGPPGELAIVLSGAGAELNGELDPAGTAAFVVLAPAVQSGETNTFYRMLPTAPDGKFRFAALPPGQYKLYAFEELDSDEWQSPAYLGRFEDAAKLIRVAAGEKSVIKLTRIPAK